MLTGWKEDSRGITEAETGLSSLSPEIQPSLRASFARGSVAAPFHLGSPMFNWPHYVINFANIPFSPSRHHFENLADQKKNTFLESIRHPNRSVNIKAGHRKVFIFQQKCLFECINLCTFDSNCTNQFALKFLHFFKLWRSHAFVRCLIFHHQSRSHCKATVHLLCMRWNQVLPLPLQSRQRKAGLQQTPSIILGTACVWFCRYWFHFVISSETRMENERKMGGEKKKKTQQCLWC